MNTKQLAEELGGIVEWEAFYNMVADLGKQLNDRQLRFLKARLIESSIARMSNGKIEWVDRIGQDHQYGDIRIETKFSTNSLTTSKGERKKGPTTSEIKLTNTLGSSDGRTLPDTFDYLLIVDTDCVAVVDRADILPFVTSNGDGLKVKVPFDKLEIVSKRSLTNQTPQNIALMAQIDTLLNEISDAYLLQNALSA